MSFKKTKAAMEAYWSGDTTERIAEDAVVTMMVSGEERVHSKDNVTGHSFSLKVCITVLLRKASEKLRGLSLVS